MEPAAEVDAARPRPAVEHPAREHHRSPRHRGLRRDDPREAGHLELGQAGLGVFFGEDLDARQVLRAVDAAELLVRERSLRRQRRQPGEEAPVAAPLPDALVLVGGNTWAPSGIRYPAE
jgi:anti-sigma factor RsiW